MALSIGIVGLPNVGKSTVFNALTHNHVLAANYPFATIEPNVGVVAVPDATTGACWPTMFGVRADPAGVGHLRRHRRHRARRVRGRGARQPVPRRHPRVPTRSARSCGSSRTTTSSTSTGGSTRASDVATIETELILADLQTVDKALGRLERDAKRGAEARRATRPQVARRATPSTRELVISKVAKGLDRDALAELHLLTDKPFIYVFNVDEATARRTRLAEPSCAASVAPAPSVVLCAKVEAELAELDDDRGARAARSPSARPSRGWPSSRGSASRRWVSRPSSRPGPRRRAPGRSARARPRPRRPARSTPTSRSTSSRPRSSPSTTWSRPAPWPRVRAAGQARIEGKEYVMRDGDVVEFRVGV